MHENVKKWISKIYHRGTSRPQSRPSLCPGINPHWLVTINDNLEISNAFKWSIPTGPDLGVKEFLPDQTKQITSSVVTEMRSGKKRYSMAG